METVYHEARKAGTYFAWWRQREAEGKRITKADYFTPNCSRLRNRLHLCQTLAEVIGSSQRGHRIRRCLVSSEQIRSHIEIFRDRRLWSGQFRSISSEQTEGWRLIWNSKPDLPSGLTRRGEDQSLIGMAPITSQGRRLHLTECHTHGPLGENGLIISCCIMDEHNALVHVCNVSHRNEACVKALPYPKTFPPVQRLMRVNHMLRNNQFQCVNPSKLGEESLCKRTKWTQDYFCHALSNGSNLQLRGIVHRKKNILKKCG